MWNTTNSVDANMIDAEFTVKVATNLNLHSVRKCLRSIQVYIDSDTVF